MTPKYWKQAKYEMLARLDNLGPFQFQLFFTLSCADMRWDENFAAVLLEKGFETNYHVIQDEEGNWDNVIEARIKGGDWKPIKQVLYEDMDESIHELLRGNVLTATRYFQHKVKNFIDRIVMGKNNPMCVSSYSYKVEFQDRGAGHIHSTLWLIRLDDLQNMYRGDDGKLKPISEGMEKEGELCGLKEAFTRLRKNLKLNNDDKYALTKFIDEFTTVSTHEKTVGSVVAKTAIEVNKHHHTKSGRPLTELAGHEGFWYEQQNMWSKYSRRSAEIEDICFAQFGKMYRSGVRLKEENEDDSEDEIEEVPESEKKFHYIMTFDKKNVKLPDNIILSNPYPRESAIMQKRSFPAVLRFNKARCDNALKFMLHELMLYRPTREEFQLDKVEALYEETF